MELNHLSSGYEPDEIPFLYSALFIRPGEPGFEPGQTESKSGVLPLDDSPISLERAILYSFLSFFQVKMKKKQKKIKIWFHLPFQKTRKKNLKKFQHIENEYTGILESNNLTNGIPSIRNKYVKFLNLKIVRIRRIKNTFEYPLSLAKGISPSKILSGIGSTSPPYQSLDRLKTNSWMNQLKTEFLLMKDLIIIRKTLDIDLFFSDTGIFWLLTRNQRT